MFIALEYYDDAVINEILNNNNITGVVLGDMYCNYRMFSGGIIELGDRIKQFKLSGKKVFYQTPCYLFDNELEITLMNIKYWSQHNLLDGVLLQDIGLLHKLGELKLDITLVWSFMGVARNRALNLLHFQFLNSLAPVVISTEQPNHYKLLKEHGINAMLIYGKIAYATVNRICYYKYQNNLYGNDCGRGCLRGTQHMKNEIFNMDMSVDGYMLGKTYEYINPEGCPELLYAQNYEECLKQIQKLKMGGFL